MSKPRLTANQQRFVECRHGPLLAVAGAGSGKTFSTIQRVLAGLADSWKKENVVLATFSKAAANDMATRLALALGDTPPVVSTIHSLAYRVCREQMPNLKILGAGPQISMRRQVAQRLGLSQAGDDESLERIGNYLSGAINRGQTPENFQAGALAGDSPLPPELFVKFWRGYVQAMERAKCVDFDYLLVRSNEILRQERSVRRRLHNLWRHVTLDEFQDTNGLQFLFFRMIVEDRALQDPFVKASLSSWEGRSLAAVGDDKQAIFGFRGSDARLILSFDRLYPGTTLVQMEENFRSQERVVLAAAAFSRQVFPTHRLSSHGVATRPQGPLIDLYRATDRADKLAFVTQWANKALSSHSVKSVAVITRHRDSSTSDGLREVVKHLNDTSLPVKIRGGEEIPLPEQGAWAAALRFVLYGREEDLRCFVETGLDVETATPLLAFWQQRGKASLCQTWQNQEEAFMAPIVERVREYFDTVAQTLNGEALSLSQLLLALIGSDEWVQGFFSRPGDEQQKVLRQLNLVFQLERQGGTPEDLLGFLEHRPEVLARIQRVHLVTAHESKGLEWDAVILDADAKGFPDQNGEAEEEERLWYVALTRAGQRLLVVAVAGAESPFLRLLPKNEIREILPLSAT